MLFSTTLLIYAFTFLTSLSVLTAMSSVGILENIFFRTISGGVVGGFTAYYMKGVNPFISFIQSSAEGDFGLSGIFMLCMLLLMLVVWSYNLFTGKELVR